MQTRNFIAPVVTLFLVLCIGNANAAEKDAIDKIYDPKSATVHLDAKDPTLNVPFDKRDFSKDKRPAGPVNVQRYNMGLAYTGIPTFFKLPIAITPEDLKAGKVEVAIVGEPTVGTFGRPGATMAASWVRMGEVLAPWGYDPTIPEIMVNPFEVLTVVDYGDIGNDPMSTERSLAHSAEIVEEIARAGVIPILVGGDHSNLYSHVVGIGRAHGKGNFTLIHIDAHADNGKPVFGHYVHIGNMNRLAVEEGWVKGENLIQAGLRSPFGYNQKSVNWFPKNNAHLYMMAEFRQRGFREVVTDIVEIVKKGPGKVYLSIDIDALEPGLAPAVTGPELGGFTTREMIELMRSIAVSADVIGVDFIEYIPHLDNAAGTTRMTVSRLIREMLGGIALRKQGIREPFYYAPETLTEKRAALLKKAK